MKMAIDPKVIKALFVAPAKGCRKLSREYESYYLAEEGDQNKTYESLYNSANKVVERERNEYVRQSEKEATSTPALASDAEGEKYKKGSDKGKRGRRGSF